MDRLRRWILGGKPSPLERVVGPEQHARDMWAGGMFYLSVVIATTLLAVVLPGPEVAGFRTRDLGLVVGLGFLLLIVGAAFGRNWSPDVFSALILLLAPVVILALYFAGPNAAMSAAIIPSMVATALIFHARRVAIILTAQTFVLYGALVAFADGYPRPVTRWVVVAGFTLATAGLVEWVLRHIRVLADRDRAKADELTVAHAQLADANQLLESRVDEQVGEIERLGRLRRFLSPQVADTVLSEGADDLLATHRRQIAVIFIDLRGFTAFSAVAEPEDVVDVLTEFHAAVGAIVKRLEATVGAFAGDGVMAYFNDPVPCDDPAGRALDMATSLRLPMADLGEKWSRRGFKIGYGVGIAYGYATLGTIGFEERSDYTPLGSVVNLASRLCDEAGNGEILLDGRAYEAVQDRVEATQTNLELKGFSGVVTAYRVVL